MHKARQCLGVGQPYCKPITIQSLKCSFLSLGSLVGRSSLWSSANDDPTICTDDPADEIMERIVKSATQVPSQRAQPRERRRSRANRKSCEFSFCVRACVLILALVGVGVECS